ncbi:MAG: mannitol-1-phosphate 5-dehydrogenase [Burkholderiaceae bacterium]|nr:mannitol-1-phosphate 5-dehydrogenase [Microbacteriaceae bacterium]
MKAVHFGAGNIGRGFVGLILHNAGYEVVFADVDAAVIDELAASDSYRVVEAGAQSTTWTVDNYTALDSRSDEAAVIAQISTADVVTTAVGAGILRFVAPLIAAAMLARAASLPPLTVMACENALGATDILAAEIRMDLGGHGEDWIAARAVFANTAVDRIVPQHGDRVGLDVLVEDFFEWAIEKRGFEKAGVPVPPITGAHFVDDLAPYIERKLFTVNTGHATVAYHGFLLGVPSLFEAVSDAAVLGEVRAVLGETSALLIERHGFDPADHLAYVDRTLERFANPALPDTPARVGRQPLRKLGRNERFVSPAVGLAALGTHPAAIVRAMGAALRFDLPEDPESAELQTLLGVMAADDLATRVTGLEPGTELFADLSRTVAGVQFRTGRSAGV